MPQPEENPTAPDAPDVVPADTEAEDDSGCVSDKKNIAVGDVTNTAAQHANKVLNPHPSIRTRKLAAPTWQDNLNNLREEDWACPYAKWSYKAPPGFLGLRDPRLGDDPLYSEKDEFFVIDNADKNDKTIPAGSRTSAIPSSKLPEQSNSSAATDPTSTIEAVHDGNDGTRELRVTVLTEANANPAEQAVPFGIFVPCPPSNLAQESDSTNNVVTSNANFAPNRESARNAEMLDAYAEVEILSVKPCVKSEDVVGAQEAVQVSDLKIDVRCIHNKTSSMTAGHEYLVVL